jgi:hypothetical protein
VVVLESELAVSSLGTSTLTGRQAYAAAVGLVGLQEVLQGVAVEAALAEVLSGSVFALVITVGGIGF